MRERLAESEQRISLSMGPSERAKRLFPRLREVVVEHRRRAAMATGANAELLELEAVQIELAADLLRILAQEQWRQREAIKLYLHAREDRPFLRRVSETWNEDPPHDP